MLKKYGHWILLGLMILITVYMDVYVARNILDSDTSEDLYHGWIIAQQNNPFTRDVYFSTELRLLDIASVFALFFYFISDWTTVRILGTIVMQAYYVVSFLYLCRQAGMRRPYTVYAAAALLIPFSTPYARVVLYHLYYIVYLANAFWLMGLTLRLFGTRPGEWRRAVLPACLLAGLWVFVGLNGIRHMMILGIPMLLFAAVKCLQMLNRHCWDPELPLRRQPFWRTDAMRLMGILMGSCVCFGVGFVINKLLLPYFGVVDMSEITYQPNASADRYLGILHGWLISTGVRSSTLPVVGIRGLSLVSALFSFTYLLFESSQAVKSPELSGRTLLKGMLAAAFVATTFIFVFDSTQRIFEQYYILVCIWAVPVLIMQLERCAQPDTTICKKLLALTACICFLFQGAYTTLYIRADKGQMDKWECLYFDRFTAMDEVRDCVAFMQESGYTHAMTDYWYANVMMEMSDGEITAAPMLVNYAKDPSIYLQQWGTSRSAFAPEKLPEKVVVFFDRSSEEAFRKHYPHAPLVHEGWTLNGYELDSGELLKNKD